MVSALGALYKATGNRTYISEALITIDGMKASMTSNGILRDGCDIAGDLCDTNAVSLSSIHANLTIICVHYNTGQLQRTCYASFGILF